MRPTLPRRPRALLLDDDPVVLRLLRRTLSSRGAEVASATEGASGVALLLDLLLDLDVLVVDLDLPGRDAWSMLRLIRGAGGEQELRVVVLADRPGAATRARLVALGADAVIDRADGPEEAASAALAAAASTRPPTRLAPSAAVRRLTGERPPLLALPALLASAAPSF